MAGRRNKKGKGWKGEGVKKERRTERKKEFRGKEGKKKEKKKKRSSADFKLVRLVLLVVLSVEREGVGRMEWSWGGNGTTVIA